MIWFILLSFILLSIILVIIGIIVKNIGMACIGIMLLGLSAILAGILEYFEKKIQRKNIWSINPPDEFVEVDFKKRNDQIVDEVFKHAKIYMKRSDIDEEIVIIKIKIFDNEIITAISLEELIEKSYR